MLASIDRALAALRDDDSRGTLAADHYWDGGLLSNTPLGPAINPLEQRAGGRAQWSGSSSSSSCSSMNAPIPRTFPEVMQRVAQLQYTSRLALDSRFFDEINDVVDLLARIEDELPADSTIHQDAVFQRLRAHRKIDHLNVVTSSLPPELSNPADFSRASIEARIQAGYDDARQQGIGDVDAAGLRFGITGTPNRSRLD
ncbi:DUF3734 domain-containing protein [Actinomycetospora lemnae]|uniref:DUF3734 domain-containing protein n=1 Tax=Actinomycetospora lemnae TaxID=3019891 RepID=A0ABT5T2J0_9PSEU|nr:DUF3734 domain-containing protein [Actinomycetospora sp. DW7H6]MDD7969311.1 DUF3734 domain-containing protein [Actinomycetospora sp. DW7H6]